MCWSIPAMPITSANKTTLMVDELEKYDVLLYPVKLCGRTLFWHAAWFMGWIEDGRIPFNFEATEHGPELKEWEAGKYPAKVCRVKGGLTKDEKKIIVLSLEELKDCPYDWPNLMKAILTLGGVTGFGDQDKIRCDELVTIPLERAIGKLNLPEIRPRGFMKSDKFEVYDVDQGTT